MKPRIRRFVGCFLFLVSLFIASPALAASPVKIVYQGFPPGGSLKECVYVQATRDAFGYVGPVSRIVWANWRFQGACNYNDTSNEFTNPRPGGWLGVYTQAVNTATGYACGYAVNASNANNTAYAIGAVGSCVPAACVSVQATGHYFHTSFHAVATTSWDPPPCI